MSLAGYNEMAYYSHVSFLSMIDEQDCVSTRDSSNQTHTDSGMTYGDDGSPWAAWRRWAIDSELSEDDLSDASIEDSSSNAASADDLERGRLWHRQSTRRSAARVSLAGYNCRGAISVSDEENTNAAGFTSFSATGGNLSAIGEVFEMGREWFDARYHTDSYSSHLEASRTEVFNMDYESPDREQRWSTSSLFAAFDALDDTAYAHSPSLFASYDALDDAVDADRSWPRWADTEEEEEELNLGLNDDPIAEAGFIFGVEYGQACVNGMTFSRRDAGAMTN